MKQLIFFLITIFAIPTILIAQPLSCYQLVWSDEFDGNNLDETKWNYQRGTWNGSEVQNCYVDANTSVSGGSLKITAEYAPNYNCFNQSRDFTSGFVQTKDKMSWTFGYFEARVKVPASNSTWPAFWMSPQSQVYGGWPQSGEIDIFEIRGHDMTESHGNAIWGNSSTDRTQNSGTYPINDANNWHIYALEWSLGELKYYIDGVHYHTVDQFPEPNATVHPGPFDIAFYIRLNMAVGGTYLTPPHNDAHNNLNGFPATMEVDWVRVYEKDNNCISECETLSNGRFENGTDNWTLQTFNGASGTLAVINNDYLKIDIINSSSANWHLGLRQEGLLLKNGKTYQVSFNAYADFNRSSNVIVHRQDGSQYYFHSQPLSTTPTDYSFSFTMNESTNTNGIISFNVGSANIDVYYDDISIIETACTSCDHNLSIMDQNIYPSNYQVSGLINSNGIVKSATEVIFEASEIDLLAGFTVEAGASFLATPNPCQMIGFILQAR